MIEGLLIVAVDCVAVVVDSVAVNVVPVVLLRVPVVVVVNVERDVVVLVEVVLVSAIKTANSAAPSSSIATLPLCISDAKLAAAIAVLKYATTITLPQFTMMLRRLVVGVPLAMMPV